MIPYSCIAIASVTLCLVPGKAFAPKGLRSMPGILGYAGHAVAAAVPGGLCLWTDPGQVLEAHLATVGTALAIGAYLILTRIAFVRDPAPARSPAPAPAPAAVAAAAQLSPFQVSQALAAGQAGLPAVAGNGLPATRA